jgi:hypothetical protein
MILSPAHPDLRDTEFMPRQRISINYFRQPGTWQGKRVRQMLSCSVRGLRESPDAWGASSFKAPRRHSGRRPFRWSETKTAAVRAGVWNFPAV